MIFGFLFFLFSFLFYKNLSGLAIISSGGWGKRRPWNGVILVRVPQSYVVNFLEKSAHFPEN